jgi:SAM-dependent methyltransferase
MDDPLPFEPRRFRTAAGHYLRGRPAYAPRLIRRVAALCGLDGQGRVLDLGCGPGQLALGFAFFAQAVVAIDPEPEMRRIAASLAEGIAPNIEIREGSSQDIGPPLGRFRLAVIGRAFHWMDRAETLRRLDAVLEPGGRVALFGTSHPDLPVNAWRGAWQELIDRYADADEHRRGRRSGGMRHEAVLFDSRFPVLERVGVIERRVTPAEDLVERALSMSSTSRARIGDKADRLAAELREALAGFARDGLMTEVVESQALLAGRAFG